jgi:hypothetical protein
MKEYYRKSAEQGFLSLPESWYAAADLQIRPSKAPISPLKDSSFGFWISDFGF